MEYSYHRWFMRTMSLVAIAYTVTLEFRWGLTLYKEHLLSFMPLAVFPPVAMTYFLFFIKIPEQRNENSTGLNSAVRGDFIKCVTLTAGSVALALLQK